MPKVLMQRVSAQKSVSAKVLLSALPLKDRMLQVMQFPVARWFAVCK